MADINQDLILKCSKLQSEIEKLKEENSRIRQDCYHEAMEQFRPIVTSQYAELIKMAAKFNMYQYNINKTLQKSIQNVRIGFTDLTAFISSPATCLKRVAGYVTKTVSMNLVKGNSFQSNIFSRDEFDKTKPNRPR